MLRILGVDAAFDGMAALRQLVLCPGQLSARRDGQLRANEVNARDSFGDGMLDLQPGVHLQKVEARIVAGALDEELDRSRVAIAGGARCGDGGFTHSATQVRADGR